MLICFKSKQNNGNLVFSAYFVWVVIPPFKRKSSPTLQTSMFPSYTTIFKNNALNWTTFLFTVIDINSVDQDVRIIADISDDDSKYP